MLIYMNLVVYLSLILIGYYMGRLSGNRILYGVTLTAGMKDQEVLTEITSHYKSQYRIDGLLLFIVSILFQRYVMAELAIVVFLGLWMVLTMYLYLKANKAMKQLKSTMKKDVIKQEVRTASLTPRAKEVYGGQWLFLIPALIVVAMTLLSVFRFDMLPDQIPLHFDAKANVDQYADKTILTVLGLPLTQLFMVIFMYVVSVLSVKYSKRSINPSKPLTSEIQTYIAANRMLMILAMITTVSVGIMGYFQLIILEVIEMSTVTATWVLIMPFGVITIGFIVFVLTTGMYGEKVDVGIEETANDLVEMEDNDRYWKWGMIYYNKNDASLMIPKRMGLGYTFNFGNPLAWIFLIGILAFIVISIIMS